MRRIIFGWLCFAFLRLGSLAEETTVSRGGDHVVNEWAREENGRSITNRFTLIQPGISYWSEEDEDWLPSSDQVQLLENGGEVATSPIKIRFAPNHNTPAGALVFTLPDGQVLKMQTVGLALTDGQDSVWIGELQDSNGILDGNNGNTIYYPNAFTGCKADIRVRVGIGQIESDIILREKLISPQLLNLNANSTYLEVFHRIIEGPQPTIHEGVIPRANGSLDRDTQLEFSETLVGQGTAFLVGTNQLPVSAEEGRVPVAKELWEDPQNQARYLIERIPLAEATAHLNQLPDRVEARVNQDSLRQRLEAAKSVAEKAGRRRPVSLAGAMERPSSGKEPRKVASAISRSTFPDGPGFVMDYTVVKTATNFTFVGSTTYLVTNAITLSSTTTIEPGVVVKFNTYTNSAPVINVTGPVNCYTTPYSPATFTSKDDNSIGESISGSTGAPANNYGWYLATLRFTEISAPAQPTSSLNFPSDSSYPHEITISDSVLRNLNWSFSNPGDSGHYAYFDLHNNVLERCSLYWIQGDDQLMGPGSLTLYFRNNLFTRSAVNLYHWDGDFQIYHNVFDNCQLSLSEQSGGSISADYNADSNGPGSGGGVFGGSHNQTFAMTFESGSLGRYYYPSGMNSLINAGNITADYWGLYHHTVKTNQVKDGTTTLDLGFHFMAVDATTGLPVDSDGDGIPDYLEDGDGNGSIGAGETAWTYGTPTFGSVPGLLVHTVLE